MPNPPMPSLSQLPQRPIFLSRDALLPESHPAPRPRQAYFLRVVTHHFPQLPPSQELSKLIPKSAVGELSEDSSNVVQLIMDAYNVRGSGRGGTGESGKGPPGRKAEPRGQSPVGITPHSSCPQSVCVVVINSSLSLALIHKS